ncbi:MAG: hypothetical protein OEQ53_21460 [Saprospiraceae bacterium]|nr:hypothetical protein [Saprospiraceae bacterium]
MRLITGLIFIFFFQIADAQRLIGLSTRWDDSFAEWILYTEDEDIEGEIVMRWPTKDDWSEWDYRIGESSGFIKVKWKNDANLWEVRGDNEIVTIRTVWQNDWRQWEVKSSDGQFDIKSKWANILEEWYLADDDRGRFDMFTNWEGDVRDWVIDDQLNDSISLHTKIALAFIPVLYATPKF